MRRFLPLWFVLFITSVTAFAPTLAQAVCPVNLPQYIERAVRACKDLERNTACYGNGDITIGITPTADSPAAVFANSGDQLPIEYLTFLQTGRDPLTAEDWGIARLEVQANLLAEEAARSSTVWLFGNTMMENRVPLVPEVVVTSKGTLNLRTLPASDADIIDQLSLRDSVIANGRTEDNRWLRVFVPRQETLAWVGMDVVTTEGNLNSLEIVTPETPFYRPFQIIDLQTGSADSPCSDVPDSGLLLQTPNEFTSVEFIINGTTLRVTGTVFVQAHVDRMMVNVLNGSAAVEADEGLEVIPAGARSVVEGTPSAAQPYVLDDLDALPIKALSYTFTVLEPLNQSDILAVLNPAPTSTPADPDPNLVPRCVRVLNQDSNVRQGPGSFYEVLTTWEKGRTVNAVYEQTDGDGITWWQVYTGAWVRADYVESTGDCDEVPITTITTGSSRSNSLKLEDCTTGNGPIRVGQHIEINFLDGGWESYGEASEAVHVAPATINVGSTRLSVHPSEPFLGSAYPERWYMRFTAYWTARPGTFKIEGERRYLRLRCNVTVPFGR